MSKLIQILKSFFIVLILTTVFLSCDETETDYKKPDYFPLNDQSKWEYQWEYKCDCPEEYVAFDAPTIWIAGDSIIQGVIYSKIENEYGLLKLVRREGSKYYEFNLYNMESLFLDTSLPEGSSWTIDTDDFWHSEYIIQRPVQKMTVNSITYYDIIVVENRTTYGIVTSDEYSVSYFHYYAKDIGEILVYNPPNTITYVSDTKFSLLKYR